MRIENEKKDNYITSLFAKEDEAMASVIKSLRQDEVQMQISPVEGKILHTLVKMIGAKKIVEVGTLGGYSAIWMARALPEDGKLYAIEMDYKKETRIRENFATCGVENRVELIIGKGKDILPNIEGKGPFDVVFIDADKINYLFYLEWAEKNVRKGGLIIGDNSFLFGTVYGCNTNEMKPETIEGMKQFNIRLADELKYTSIILPTSEGMTVAVKNF